MPHIPVLENSSPVGPSIEGQSAPHWRFEPEVLIAAGPSLMGATAISYARVAGSNDRIQLGHIGVGNRGRETRPSSPD